MFDHSKLDQDPSGNPGINSRIFSTSNDLSEIIKPKNGVRLKNNRVDIGTGRYRNTNPSKMSLVDYQDLAKQHQSLATIALRGAERESPQGDSLFLSMGQQVSPRGFESVREEHDEHYKTRKDPEDDLAHRKESQFKSHNQIDDFASTWKMKKYMPRHEISHDSIQFTVAAEDGTRKRYKKYRNSKMN